MQQTIQNTEPENEFDTTEHYIFAPSISMRKIVDGKSYYVRRFFKGGKDFEKTMQSLAVKQIYNKR